MSAAPDNIGCTAALAALADYLKQELAPEREVLVRHHLEICRKCVTYATFERNFVQMLAAVGREQRCPDAVRVRILLALRTAGEH